MYLFFRVFKKTSKLTSNSFFSSFVLKKKKKIKYSFVFFFIVISYYLKIRSFEIALKLIEITKNYSVESNSWKTLKSKKYLKIFCANNWDLKHFWGNQIFFFNFFFNFYFMAFLKNKMLSKLKIQNYQVSLLTKLLSWEIMKEFKINYK